MLTKKQPETRKYQRRDWPMHVKQWQASGLSQTEYCRQNNLNDRSFSNNKGKLINRVRTNSKTDKFIKIPSSQTIGDREVHEYEIILPGNIRIRTNNNFNPINLKNLIQTLTEL